MEDMRPGLRHGDLTTTGGVIIATGRMRFHGKEVAAEGELATCPACKSVGYLVNDAYPAFGLPGGRQLAIQGAWIFCKCANPPRAIASTDKFRVAVNRAGSGAPAPASALPLPLVPSVAPSYTPQREHSQEPEDAVEYYFEIVDARTETPIDGMTYKLSNGGQTWVRDAKLEGGKTHAVSATSHQHLNFVAWIAGDAR